MRHTYFNRAEVDLEGQCFAKSFMRFSCSGSPAALVSADCSMYYRHDVKANTLSLILTRTTRMEDKTENWFTHCPDTFTVVGKHSYGFSLCFGGETADVTRFRQTLSYPLLTAAKNGWGGSFGPVESLATLNQSNVVVTALYREKNRTVLRLYETEGKRCRLCIRTRIPFRRAYRADLLLEPLQEMDCAVDAENGRLCLDVEPWKIETLVLEDGK